MKSMNTKTFAVALVGALAAAMAQGLIFWQHDH